MTQPSPADSLDQRMAFSVDEVCAFLNMSHVTVYARIKDGSLQSIKFGGRRLISRKSVEEFMGIKPPPLDSNGAPETTKVYFIDAGDFIKIGYARSPERRRMELQIGSPSKLELICSIGGDQELETKLHKQFAHLRSHGEWFRAEPELRQYIRGLMT